VVAGSATSCSTPRKARRSSTSALGLPVRLINGSREKDQLVSSCSRLLQPWRSNIRGPKKCVAVSFADHTITAFSTYYFYCTRCQPRLHASRRPSWRRPGESIIRAPLQHHASLTCWLVPPRPGGHAIKYCVCKSGILAVDHWLRGAAHLPP